MTAFLIFIGAGFGGLLRYASNLLFANFSTMLVNVIGSFFMGLITAILLVKLPENESLKLFITTGFLGGFTTFSAFSLEAYNLYMRGETLNSLIYVVLSVILSLIALVFGVWLAKTMT